MNKVEFLRAIQEKVSIEIPQKDLAEILKAQEEKKQIVTTGILKKKEQKGKTL